MHENKQITSGLGVLPQASFWSVFIIIIVLFFFRAYLFRSGEQDLFLPCLVMDLLVLEKWTEMLVPSLASTSSDWFLVVWWPFGSPSIPSLVEGDSLFLLEPCFAYKLYFAPHVSFWELAFFFCSGFCVGLFTDLEML